MNPEVGRAGHTNVDSVQLLKFECNLCRGSQSRCAKKGVANLFAECSRPSVDRADHTKFDSIQLWKPEFNLCSRSSQSLAVITVHSCIILWSSNSTESISLHYTWHAARYSVWRWGVDGCEERWRVNEDVLAGLRFLVTHYFILFASLQNRGEGISKLALFMNVQWYELSISIYFFSECLSLFCVCSY